ncbi:MAG: ATP-dependent Clp protease ATP-binding subunit ClpX, partial [Acidimicrobiaceae bacterium]|nr:ATP-dependent Clp protease ATP-binding subunit ClpX [Acidimicrobiaceae bacterium]
LTKYGLIPEFIGRLPVMGAVGSLQRDALMRILVEPRNALVKQYQKMFRFENVDLRFEEDALEAVADEAIKRASGARGLRAVLEEVLLDIMYDLPGREDVDTVVIDREAVCRNVNPTLVPRAEEADDTRSRQAS